MISPAKISVGMWGTEGVLQWQFIQEDEKLYIMKINAEPSVNRKTILEKIKNIVGNDAEINIEFIDEIPVLSSNKRRAVICNYKKED